MKLPNPFYMKKYWILFIVLVGSIHHLQAQNTTLLRIIVLGAHPDDCDQDAGGTAALFASMGHAVKFVSVTNGDAGHQSIGGGMLAKRRFAEAQEAGKRLGVTYDVLDNHDGELVPNLQVRLQVIRKIREWNADVVIAPRPNDYHPDHRYTGILVQDSAYMVTVPFFCPDVPFLKKNPVFLYASDGFQRPNPFRADVAVAIDDVMESTLDALLVMESQIHEGGANGYTGLYPDDEAGKQRRRDEVRRDLAKRYAGNADNYRDALVKFYGGEQGRKVKYAQAFEVCEYGRQPSRDDLKEMFPF